MRHSVTAYAPGSIGNVGPGLDILGLAVAGCGDEVTLTLADHPGISVQHAGHPDLPTDPAKHASAISAAEVFCRARFDHGVTMTVRKGLPLSGGQGGSAASAIAGAVAANALAGAELSSGALLECGLVAEAQLAGRHADNLAPSLLGGLVLVRSLDPIDVVRLPVPPALRLVLVRPDQQLRTRDARAVLPAVIDREAALHQAANVAAMVAAACAGDVVAFGRAIDDQIAEPVRARLLPGFIEAKRAALEAGALGCSISGAGPTAFAIADDDATGATIAAAMTAAYARIGVQATARVAQVDTTGARLIR